MTTALTLASGVQAADSPARLAIYYGYPSLVNGAAGDTTKAARVFSRYDAVVLGDGLEFTDRQPDRRPQGDPVEHRRVIQIIAAARQISPTTHFFGYVCLGDIPGAPPNKKALSPQQLESRIQLWKAMGVDGIFLDEAGYDYSVVTRERQNLAVKMIHDLGMSAFMNAYFVDHLFSTEKQPAHANGPNKNPDQVATLLDQRDFFLLESFQIRNGLYESVPAWQARLHQALGYRQTHGTQIFATTTTTARQPFNPQKFNYAWWTAKLYGLDGFSWGEPNFAASNNSLPDRHCLESAPSTSSAETAGVSEVSTDGVHFWKASGTSLLVIDSTNHSVRRVVPATFTEPAETPKFLSSPAGSSPVTCNGRTP